MNFLVSKVAQDEGILFCFAYNGDMEYRQEIFHLLWEPHVSWVKNGYYFCLSLNTSIIFGIDKDLGAH